MEIIDASHLSAEQKESASAALTSYMAAESANTKAPPHYANLEKAVICSYEAMAKNVIFKSFENNYKHRKLFSKNQTIIYLSNRAANLRPVRWCIK